MHLKALRESLKLISDPESDIFRGAKSASSIQGWKNVIRIGWPVTQKTRVLPVGYTILRRSSSHNEGYEDLLLCLEGESLLERKEREVLCNSRVLCTLLAILMVSESRRHCFRHCFIAYLLSVCWILSWIVGTLDTTVAKTFQRIFSSSG